jgi:hypothetical protein
MPVQIPSWHDRFEAKKSAGDLHHRRIACLVFMIAGLFGFVLNMLDQRFGSRSQNAVFHDHADLG